MQLIPCFGLLNTKRRLSLTILGRKGIIRVGSTIVVNAFTIWCICILGSKSYNSRIVRPSEPGGGVDLAAGFSGVSSSLSASFSQSSSSSASRGPDFDAWGTSCAVSFKSNKDPNFCVIFSTFLFVVLDPLIRSERVDGFMSRKARNFVPQGPKLWSNSKLLEFIISSLQCWEHIPAICSGRIISIPRALAYVVNNQPHQAHGILIYGH